MGTPDAPVGNCQALGATGAFYRRQPNPRVVAGRQFTDGARDTTVENPDLVWDPAGNTWHLYYESDHGTFGGSTVKVIRHATSTDLATWTFDDVPTLMNGTQPTVVVDGSGVFHMLFSDGVSFHAATSSDGTSFTNASTVVTPADVYPGATMATIADPEMVLADGTYHLWLTSLASNGSTLTAKGVAHMTSSNGTTWTVDQAPVTTLLRQSAVPTSGGSHPTAIYDEVHCRFELWLSSDVAADTNAQPIASTSKTAGWWHASSTNGTSWTTSYQQTRDLVWDDTANGEHLGLFQGADVGVRSTGRYLLYPAADNQNVPSGATLQTGSGAVPGVMTLNLATRDAPPS